MNVYIYAADIFCEQCGEDIRKQLTSEGLAPKDPDDERSYDSGEFPKGPYSDGGGESDCPQHCGAGSDCLRANMTVWQLIRKRTKEGWEFQCGRHQGLRGYWACFLSEKCDCECEECGEFLVAWESAGHALTIKEAIRMADRIIQFDDVTIPEISEFVKATEPKPEPELEPVACNQCLAITGGAGCEKCKHWEELT